MRSPPPPARPCSEGRVASLGVRLPSAVVLSLLPLAAWFALLAAYGGPRQPFRTAQWDWTLVERRFDDLLFRGYFGQPVITVEFQSPDRRGPGADPPLGGRG